MVKAEEFIGIWMLLNKIPVVNVWQAPNTFGELIEACKNQEFEFKKAFKRLAPRIRDGKKHFLLMGFPIAERLGCTKTRNIWKGILLPTLSYGENYAPGFRKDEKGWLANDFRNILKNKTIINWLLSENWNASSALSRGRYNSKVRTKKYLIIGAGTLSAFVSEQLVRNGIEDITIADNDIFHVGNLARHTLGIEDIAYNKAERLSNRLNRLNPHARAKSINHKITIRDYNIVEKYDVIIDCSADGKLIQDLSVMEIVKSIVFCSVSFGFAANKLYIYCSDLKNLDPHDYSNAFRATLEQEQRDIDLSKLPQDGIGCWSPAFPAKTSDIMLAASTVVPIITKYIDEGEHSTKTFIYNKHYNDEGYFVGYVEDDEVY